ncbi:MAG: PQQ-binding-like beta-propeller repeat protein [Planctomycetota bacterium]|nr:PQQ-binding-like beta-propeller repeat protein [Planctomycetota bacterium]
MTMCRMALLLIWLGTPAVSRSAEPEAVQDPAPPKVSGKASNTTAPPLKAYVRVKKGATAKPLSKEAKTHAWTGFLGPTRDGVSTETHLLKTWPKAGPTKVWELAAGDGYASPAIRHPYLVYPHRVDDSVLVECLHAETGQQYWQYKFATAYRDRLGYSSGPRSTPVIDGNRVYIYGAEGMLICLELATGRPIWKRDLVREFRVPQDFFGAVGTPLLVDDRLVVNIGKVGGPCVAAFHTLTGKLVWVSGKKWGPSYASPRLVTIHGKKRVLVFAGGESRPSTGGLMLIDPSNGKLGLEFPWRSRKYESVNASCPLVVGGNRIFVSASYQTGSALLEVGPDLSSHKVVWKMVDAEHNTEPDQLGLHWGTPLIKDGYLYGFDGRNEPDASLVCVDLKAGRVLWREEPEWEQTVTVQGVEQTLTLSTLRGSFLAADGQALILGELGQLMWMDLTPKGYKITQRSSLFLARESWCPPVISRGLLYISQNMRDPVTRSSPRLICYDLRRP